MTHLRHSLMNLTRGQGLGFQVVGTVIDKRMLVTTAGGPACPWAGHPVAVFPDSGTHFLTAGQISVAGASLITAMVTLGHREQTEGVTNITLGSA